MWLAFAACLGSEALCQLDEAAYRRYYKLLEFVFITKPCTGPKCANEAPPFFRVSLSLACGA